MRVILASKDEDATEWLAGVLGSGGYSVVVLPDATPESPELRNAELLIADPEAIKALGEAGPKRRLLLSPRGSMVDMSMINSFADVLTPDPLAPKDVDVAFPVLHGPHGEDGSLQGLFELCDLAYVGAGIEGSAIGINKVTHKRLFAEAGLPIVDFVAFMRDDWTLN